MDKEQLSEVFSLAEYLGFDPKTEINSKVFNHVCNGLDTYYIPDLEYYLVLCEIQKWLREVHNIHISPMFIGPDTNKYQYRTDVEGSGNTGEYSKWFTNFEECFVDGLMFGLNLLKNENN